MWIIITWTEFGWGDALTVLGEEGLTRRFCSEAEAMEWAEDNLNASYKVVKLL